VTTATATTVLPQFVFAALVFIENVLASKLNQDFGTVITCFRSDMKVSCAELDTDQSTFVNTTTIIIIIIIKKP